MEERYFHEVHVQRTIETLMDEPFHVGIIEDICTAVGASSHTTIPYELSPAELRSFLLQEEILQND